MNIVVTAGTTYEFIDAVRFIGNPASGKMGYEIAKAAVARGHKCTLISGPTYLKPPNRVKILKVVSAQDMYREVMKAYKNADAVVMAAAVSDYRPQKRYINKIKKDSKILNLKLIKTPDILSRIGKNKGKRILIGFALEVQNAQKNAIEKLHKKNLDYIVLNMPMSFGKDKISASIISKDEKIVELKSISKKILARKLIKLLERKG